MHTYAWLELEGGMWHLLTRLSADPGESTRRWSNSRLAILELMEEGWTVVRPYSAESSVSLADEPVLGYGLARTVH